MPTIPPEWPPIRELIENPDHDRLLAIVQSLDTGQHRAVAAAVKSYARERQRDFNTRFDSASLTVVGLGVLTDSAAAASWLRRWRISSFVWTEPAPVASEDDHLQWAASYGMRRDPRHRSVRAHVLMLLEDRDPAWLARFASHLAARLSSRQGEDPDLFDIVEVLRRKTGMAPPESDGYLAQLLYSSWSDADILRSAIAEDPRYIALVPRIFDIEAIGLYLAWATEHIERLVALTRDRIIDREVFLDACIGRLQRPGRPKATGAYLSLLEALEPTLDEITARLRDYLALLPETMSTVAAVAQRDLQRVDETHGLTSMQMDEATRSVLSRSEKKLHKAQLSWLGQHLQRNPEGVRTLVRAAATAFTHPAVDVQRAAVTWISTRLAPLSTADRDELLLAADALPADLRAILRNAAGTATTDRAAPAPSAQVTLKPPVPRKLEPVESPAELAELLLLMFTGRDNTDSPSLERVLEGLIRYSQHDRNVLRSALTPVTTHDFYPWHRKPVERSYGSCDGVSTDQALSELLAAAIDQPAQPSMKEHCGHALSRPQHVLIHRILELAEPLRSGQLRDLISFPTWTTGSLTPADLIRRLRKAKDARWEPVSGDLDLALLRLDLTETDVTALSQELHGIGSSAGERAAGWFLAGPPGTPAMNMVERQCWEWDSSIGKRIPVGSLLDVEPIADRTDTDYGAAWREMTHQTGQHDEPHSMSDWLDKPRCWPSILPQHRDLIAANGGIHAGLARAEILPLLAETNGPVGHALHLGIAYVLAANTPVARADAVDAMLILAARQQLDGTAIGQVLGTLTSRQNITTSRILAPLRDAASAGAAAQVSHLLAALTTSILTGDAKPPNGFADLLALTAETVEMSGTSIHIEGLAALAERRGSSRQNTEARRHHALLSVR
jgi:hypothetical protein